MLGNLSDQVPLKHYAYDINLYWNVVIGNNNFQELICDIDAVSYTIIFANLLLTNLKAVF